MTTTTTRGKRSLLALAMAAALLLAAFTDPADAAPGKGGTIVFESNRSTGQGVDNPTGDFEIFSMKPDGTGLKQLTNNEVVVDYAPVLSKDGTKIAYTSEAAGALNPEGDSEVYAMNAADGSNKQNLTNNAGIHDYHPDYSPDGAKIAYSSYRAQTSNPEGDDEVYVMDAADGSNQQNLTNNAGTGDSSPDYSPDGAKIAYESDRAQTSNPEGDFEVYAMDADGSNQQNLTNNAGGIGDLSPDYSPDGAKIAYTSGAYQNQGVQTSNPEGDFEIYAMDADGSDPQNLTNTAGGIDDGYPDYSPNGKKIAYLSIGVQTSNPQGDYDVYAMNAANSSKKKNLTKTDGNVVDGIPSWESAG